MAKNNEAAVALSLGQDIEDLEERKNYLSDNADDVEEMSFTKRFDSETLMKKKDKYVAAASKVSDIEEQIKDFREEKKAELKPYKEECAKLLQEIKQKGSQVTERVYKFVDREARMTAWYDKEGNLVTSRQATRDELPCNIHSIAREQKAK